MDERGEFSDLVPIEPCRMIHVGGPLLLIECGNPIVSKTGPSFPQRHLKS